MDNVNNTSLSFLNHSTSTPDSQETQYVESIKNVFNYSFNLVAFLLTINIVMEILTLLGNLMVILTVVVYRQLWVPSNILVASLAVADFIIGLFLQTSNAWNLLKALLREKRNCGLQCTKLLEIMGVVLITVSLGHLSIITVDRLIAIVCPLRYVTIITMSRTKKAVMFTWATSIVFGFLTSIPSSFGNGMKTLWLLLVALTCTFMITLYGRLYAISRKHARQIRNEMQAFTPGAETKAERRSLITVAIVTIAMVTSYVPIVAIELDTKLASEERGETAKLVHDIVKQFAMVLVLFNSTLNPLVYFFRSEKLRSYNYKLIKSIPRKMQELFS